MINTPCLNRFLVKHLHLIIKAQFSARRDVLNRKKANTHDTAHIPFLHFAIGIAAVVSEPQQICMTRCINDLSNNIKFRAKIRAKKKIVRAHSVEHVLMTIVIKSRFTSSGPSCSK